MEYCKSVLFNKTFSMKEKMHIVVLSLWICTLIGMTFAVSTKDRQEKNPQLNSSAVETTKFICNAATISESSQATKEYNENLNKWLLLFNKIDSLGGDIIAFKDPCDGLKWKEKSQCIKKNVQLRTALQQIKKLEKKIIPYEDCQASLWVLNKPEKTVGEEEKSTTKVDKKSEEKSKIKDCGTIAVDMLINSKGTAQENKNTTCFSKAILECSPSLLNIKDSEVGNYTYQVGTKNWSNCPISIVFPIGKRTCDIPLYFMSNMKDYISRESVPVTEVIAPIMYLITYQGVTDEKTGKETKISCQDYEENESTNIVQWSEWEWSTCSNNKQKRTVECQSDGKKVADNKCVWKKPSTSKICKDSASSSNSNKTTTSKCTDSDDGLDYTKKWSVTGIWDFYTGDLNDPTLNTTHTDMCLNNYGTTNGLPIWLLEYSCDSDGRKTSTDYMCQNGCTEGACVTTQASTGTSKCTDSDGGSELFIKWTATNGTVTKTDICTRKFISNTFGEPNFLHVTECSVANGDECYIEEAVCLTGSESGLVGQWGSGELRNKCIFGCSNGACKKS